jgi:hypothetical protein
MKIESWQKNKSVERTKPGSKNPYKITYMDGQEKWTDDRPGDGKLGPRSRRLLEKKQSRPSIQRSKKRLDIVRDKFVSGKVSSDGVNEVVDKIIVSLGREVAKETIGIWIKENSGLEGKGKEVMSIIRDRKNAKLRKDMQSMEREAKISDKVAYDNTAWVRYNMRLSREMKEAFLKLKALTQPWMWTVRERTLLESYEFRAVTSRTDGDALLQVTYSKSGGDFTGLIWFGIGNKELISVEYSDDTEFLNHVMSLDHILPAEIREWQGKMVASKGTENE